MMSPRCLAVPLLAVGLLATSPVAGASSPEHFKLRAAYVPPAKAGADGAIAVTFTAQDPDVRVNEEPAPRLKLDEAQKVLVDKQAPPSRRASAYDPANGKYLDLALPVSFPVAPAPGAAKGTHDVKASVTFFYCSKREGWCRKGTTEVDVPVRID